LIIHVQHHPCEEILRTQQTHDRRQLEIQLHAQRRSRLLQEHYPGPQVRPRQGRYSFNHADVIISPVSLHIPAILNLDPKGQHHYRVAAQNCSNYGLGAYTGEVSPKHLKDMGIEWVILGHSERRTLMGEKDDLIVSKTKLAIENGLKVIYCFG
jgi:hypothetical protein